MQAGLLHTYRLPLSNRSWLAWALSAVLVVAYLLLVVAGALELRQVPEVAIAASGFGLMSLFIARSLTRMQREALEAANAR